jgi:hypothetical protein
MFITGTHAERLRSEFAERPLRDDELRRVRGLGELYVALKSVHESVHVGDEYEFVYSLFIDDVEYAFYHPRGGELDAEEAA